MTRWPSLRAGALAAGVICSPTAGLAQACAQQRPGWDGGPVSPLAELLFLLQTPVVIALVLATALVLRFRSQWGGLAAVVCWSGLTYFLTSDRVVADAKLEGCVGSPSFFIGAVFVLCIGIVLYTAPLPKRD